jgi:hypothetical protein
MTNKSSWVHYRANEGATVGEDAFGIPERSSKQTQGNPSDPISKEPRALSLRHLQRDSTSGISRAHLQ